MTATWILQRAQSISTLDTSTGAIVISRSVTFAKTAEIMPINPQSDSTSCVINVLGEGDDDEEMNLTSMDDGVNTPRSGSPGSVRVGTEPTERPFGAIPTCR